MRTPIDLDLEDAGTPTEEAARSSADESPRPPLVGPPNGKAWERLLLFEQERGLVEPDTEPPDTLTEAVRALDNDPMQTRSDLTVDYAEALEATELDTERARARRRRRGDPSVRRSCGTGRPTDPARDHGSTSPAGSPRSQSTRRTPHTCLPERPAEACGRVGTAARRGFLAAMPSRPSRWVHSPSIR